MVAGEPEECEEGRALPSRVIVARGSAPVGGPSDRLVQLGTAGPARPTRGRMCARVPWNTRVESFCQGLEVDQFLVLRGCFCGGAAGDGVVYPGVLFWGWTVRPCPWGSTSCRVQSSKRASPLGPWFSA